MSTLVSQPTREIVYAARRSNLRLTKRRRFPIRNPVTGEVEGTTPGEYVGFRDGKFSAPPEGTFVLQDTLDGGIAEVDAADLHVWLSKHRLNGDVLEGFWRVEQAAPPVSAEEIDTITEAAMALDEDTLRKILEQELSGWKRPEIIGSVEKRLAQVDQIRAEAEAAAKKAK